MQLEKKQQNKNERLEFFFCFSFFFYLLQHNDLVGIHDCGQPVGDEHRRPFLDHLPHGTQDVLGAGGGKQSMTSHTKIRHIWSPGAGCKETLENIHCQSRVWTHFLMHADTEDVHFHVCSYVV